MRAVLKQRLVRREVVGVRNRHLGRSSGYRIDLLAAPSQAERSVAIAVFVPGYSGGTATESHRLPYSSVEHSSTDTQVVAQIVSRILTIATEVNRIHWRMGTLPVRVDYFRRNTNVARRVFVPALRVEYPQAHHDAERRATG